MKTAQEQCDEFIQMVFPNTAKDMPPRLREQVEMVFHAGFIAAFKTMVQASDIQDEKETMKCLDRYRDELIKYAVAHSMTVADAEKN